MAVQPTQANLATAVPPTGGEVVVAGLEQPVSITRDELGVAHVRARSDRDAFFAQGYVHAQDRLWHMDYDRRRAYGRAAEWLGPTAVDQDVLMRRARVAATARADYEVAQPETRAMLDAYAAGVNAFMVTAGVLPIEYALLDATPEPWQPWDGLAVYKVRHVLMGVVEAKLWRGKLVTQVGPEKLLQLYQNGRPDELLILPPNATASTWTSAPLSEIERWVGELAWLRDEQGGSNSWVVAPGRTSTGGALLAGDPHRAPDVPNVYYQNHVAGATFDVVGMSFPGLPGFPHFGHNANVAWCVTHAMADTQDLYVEEFDPAHPSRYRWLDGWREAEVRQEIVSVRGGEPVTVEAVVTHHGPVIAGTAARGHAIALRYTALQPGNRTWDCLLPMLRARSTDELQEAMRRWVDPANNFLMTDIHGNIAYRTRGQVPVRHPLNAWIPVPGWTGDYEWSGLVPFEEMPAQKNPDTGWILTANNRIVGPEYPHYLSHFYAADDRAQRIRTHLTQPKAFSIADLTAIHADIVSRPAPQVVAALADVRLGTPLTAEAKRVLLEWDGRMTADQAAPLIFSSLREEVLASILRPLLGPLAEEPFTVTGAGAPGMVALLRRRLGLNVALDKTELLPQGHDWKQMLADGLERAVAGLAAQYGDDVRSWRWGVPHALRPAHPIATVQPDLGVWLNPPSAPMGGDGDTVQAASYHPATGFKVTSTSVARYCFDVADWERSGWVVPYGVSGHPGSPHYADQQPAWLEHRLLPMHYHWASIAKAAQSRQVLNPAAPAG